MKKKIIALILILVLTLLFSSTIFAYASDATEVVLMPCTETEWIPCTGTARIAQEVRPLPPLDIGE